MTVFRTQKTPCLKGTIRKGEKNKKNQANKYMGKKLPLAVHQCLMLSAA